MNFKANKTISNFVSCALCLISMVLNAQVQSSADSTKIKIGQEIKFKIEVEADTTDVVVFPEGQTFLPLEMIESYKIDTTKKDAKYRLIKAYGLTQFDSGSYSIPKQKITIGTNVFYTDSLRVDVNNIEVDTTKQGLYDIKPFIEVEKSRSKTWLIILCVILIIALVAFLLYWFIWRKKPLTDEDKIALLPPYDRAKLALKKLDESTYLENAELKDYYSELTFIIRKYLDEKVYDKALESTTDELISRLNLLNDANQIELSKEDIVNLETILKRADLVKFAKSAPDVELAKFDRNTIDIEIDHVKEALPEPTEEEKLLNQQYKEEQERKKKRKKIILTIAISVFLVIATFVGFGLKYGFTYVKDTLIGHESKELLEGNWVYSEYGVPPVSIETPKVLKRQTIVIKDSLGQDSDSKYDSFYYGSMIDDYYLMLRTVPVTSEGLVEFFAKNPNIDMAAFEDMSEDKFNEFIVGYFAQEFINVFETEGAEDIVYLKQKYSLETDGSQGLKSYGSLTGTNAVSGNKSEYQYEIYNFFEKEALQVIVFMYKKDDIYASKITERILKSIRIFSEEELNKEEN